MSFSAHTSAPPIQSQRRIVQTGTPSAKTASPTSAASAGIVQRPNGIGVAARGAPAPILANRVFPRATASAISNTRQSSTSTPASMLPAAPSKVTWNC